MEIKPRENRLNAISMDGVFASAAMAMHAPHRNALFTLNLSDVLFFDPYSVVGICVLVEHLKSHSRLRPRILLPKNLNVRNYIRRVGLLNRLGEFADFDDSLKIDVPTASSDVLLGLSRIDSKKSINKAIEELLKILATNLGYSPKSVNAVASTISELCFNVLDHSESSGWAVAQRYTRPGGGRYLWIGVADGGVGIRESLGGRYDISAWTHFDAIINALKKQYSRLPNRGLGLHMVRRIVFDFGGSLHIRTGDSRLYLTARPLGFCGSMFPGTQVGISLSEHAGA